MSKYLPAIITGFVVALIVGFGVGFLLSSLGAPDFRLALMTGAGAGVVTAYVRANLAGNRKLSNASEADKRAALGRTPPTGKALVFLYREGFVAKLAGLNLALDGREVVQLQAPRFTCVAVPEGSHTLTAVFGGFAGAQSNPSELKFDAPRDGAVAVRITMAFGMVKGGITLTLQPDLAQAKLAMASMAMTPADVAEL
jgi:hypothetical protein